MTNAQTNAAANLAAAEAVVSMTGNRKSGFGTLHAAGIAGGVIGAIANYAEGHSLVSSIAGGLIGAGAGYAVAEAIDFGQTSFTGQMLGGLTASMFGLSVSSLGTSLVSSMEKLGKAESVTAE